MGRQRKRVLKAVLMKSTPTATMYDIDIDGKYMGLWTEQKIEAFLKFNPKYEVEYSVNQKQKP